MTRTNSIYLLGMPGCGKSTLGKQFAAFSGYTYADCDDLIIQEQGKSIEQIYKEGGEMSFRKLEHELIKSFDGVENTVVCTGGGLPCFNGNMEIMNQQGITVFMDISAEEIWQRVKNTDFSGRPIYQNKTPKEIQEVIINTYAERRKIYSKAAITLKSDAITLDDLTNALEKLKLN